MVKRYLVTITALVDADSDIVYDRINEFASNIVNTTGLPVKTKVKPLPTKEEFDSMSIREIDKWMRKIPC